MAVHPEVRTLGDVPRHHSQARGDDMARRLARGFRRRRSRGRRRSGAEVESALDGHPHPAEVAVIGVPEEKCGEAVKAVIVPRAGTAADADAILTCTRQRIAGYEVPKSVTFIDALPRNASGKVLTTELRKPFRARRDPQVN